MKTSEIVLSPFKGNFLIRCYDIQIYEDDRTDKQMFHLDKNYHIHL
jgi:hypothetical protein